MRILNSKLIIYYIYWAVHLEFISLSILLDQFIRQYIFVKVCIRNSSIVNYLCHYIMLYNVPKSIIKKIVLWQSLKFVLLFSLCKDICPYTCIKQTIHADIRLCKCLYLMHCIHVLSKTSKWNLRFWCHRNIVLLEIHNSTDRRFTVSPGKHLFYIY